MHKMLTYYRQFRNGDLDPDPHEEKASYARIPEAKKPKSSHVTFNFYYTFILYYYILYIIILYIYCQQCQESKSESQSGSPRTVVWKFSWIRIHQDPDTCMRNHTCDITVSEHARLVVR